MSSSAAASSRRLVAHIRKVRSGAASDDARADLQARLVLFTKVMFWTFLALMSFLGGAYWKYPALEPAHNTVIFATGGVGLVMLVVIWQVVLARPRTLRTLYRIDLVLAAGIGYAFATSSALAPLLPAATYTTLIYASFTVFMRAIITPSSGRRTAVVSSVMFGELVIGAAIMVASRPPDHHDLPGPMLMVGGIIFALIAITLATVGSEVIYGLRRQVTTAKQLGAYTLEQKIGEGGMGAVYRAHHVLLRRATAIKLLLPERVGAESVARFEREVQMMSTLTHPNTVAVFDFGHGPGGAFYYAMEYLAGINLDQLVRRDGPQPAARVIRVLAQVCGALHEAHRAGLIHRDVKPANIILCERGGVPDVAKVVDFGIARELDAGAQRPIQGIVGTPDYIAPEAVTHPAEVGPAADLYGVGAVGYFLLTGRRLFDGETALDVCTQHVTTAPRRPSEVAARDLPAALEELILRCLAKAPGARPRSARALAEELAALPDPGDWSSGDAEAWWEQFRAGEAQAESAASAATLTIDIELEDRV